MCTYTQVLLQVDVTPAVALCAEAIRGIDVTYFVGPVDVPDTTYYAGYTMTQLNTTRVCETYVSDECVAKKGAEACVQEQVSPAVGCIHLWMPLCLTPVAAGHACSCTVLPHWLFC